MMKLITLLSTLTLAAMLIGCEKKKKYYPPNTVLPLEKALKVCMLKWWIAPYTVGPMKLTKEEFIERGDDWYTPEQIKKMRAEGYSEKSIRGYITLALDARRSTWKRFVQAAQGEDFYTLEIHVDPKKMNHPDHPSYNRSSMLMSIWCLKKKKGKFCVVYRTGNWHD